MVKDRLDELKKKAENEKSKKKKDVSIDIDEDPLKNIFDLVQQITEGIEKITENLELCRSYMKNIKESPFREKELCEKITEMFIQNGKITHTINTKLKKFENYVKSSDNKTCTVGRIEMIQFNTLKIRFKGCLKKNNEEMEIFKSLRMNTYKAQLKAKGVNVTDEEITELLNGEEDVQIFTDNHIMETAEARRLLSEAEELNEQLLKIEHLLIEVRDMFVQMSILVDEQQELIDVVEYQAGQALDFVSKTPKILKEAEAKKRRALKLKLIFLSIITFIILLIILSFVYG